MSLIDVQMDDGSVMLARVCYKEDDGYTVQYLEETKSEGVFKFNKSKIHVDKDSVTGFYDTEDISQVGYSEIGDNRYVADDSDYEPSSESEQDSEDESLCEEDEEN